jgi:hypothetical protein
MHQPDQQPRFYYHGAAFALGGQITRPFNEIIEAQAATSLPSVGGYGAARVEKFRYRDLISFEHAESVVTGSEREGVHDTLAMTIIEGLNIMNIVTADKVVARLTSSHGPGSDISLLPVGSYFENLRIAGRPIETRAVDVLHRCGRLSELESSYRSEDAPFVDRDGRPYRFAERRTETARVEGSPKGHIRHIDDCCMMTSIFGPPDVAAPFETKPGGGIYVSGFGEIRLGQYMVMREARRLTMIVIHLGCAIHGTVAVGEPVGNGTTYP